MLFLRTNARVKLWMIKWKRFSFVNDAIFFTRFTFTETGLFGARKPGPKALLPEADRLAVPIMLLALLFFPSLPLTPHWLILFRLAWAGMHLMQFYVQAVWQWRVPSFCAINISFSIWMQIWDVAPGILMGSPMKNNPVWIWFVWAQNKYGAM